MPIIQVTAADLARSKTLDVGWYGTTIIKIDAQATTTEKGQSINYIVTFLVDDKDSGVEGKEIEQYFNSKGIGFGFLTLYTAATGIPLNPGDRFNTDDMVNKKLDTYFTVEVYQGRPQNRATQFLPYGKGKEMQPF